MASVVAVVLSFLVRPIRPTCIETYVHLLRTHRIVGRTAKQASDVHLGIGQHDCSIRDRRCLPRLPCRTSSARIVSSTRSRDWVPGRRQVGKVGLDNSATTTQHVPSFSDDLSAHPGFHTVSQKLVLRTPYSSVLWSNALLTSYLWSTRSFLPLPLPLSLESVYCR